MLHAPYSHIPHIHTYTHTYIHTYMHIHMHAGAICSEAISCIRTVVSLRAEKQEIRTFSERLQLSESHTDSLSRMQATITFLSVAVFFGTFAVGLWFGAYLQVWEAYIHTYIQTYIRTYIRSHKRMYTRACMSAWKHVLCMHKEKRTGTVQIGNYTHTHTYIDTYIHH